MQYFLLPLRIVYVLYAVTTFVLTMFLVIPFVLIASFFGKIEGGNFIYKLCSWWGDVWFFLVGLRHRNLYEVSHDKSRQYIFVANHISYLDAAIIVKTIRQPVRVLGKIEMSKIPIFGFIYKNAIVTVDRSSAENRARGVRVLKSVLKKGISIFIFPEGTFNLTRQPVKEFYDGAFRIAIETQTPIKPVLFLDAYDRMNHSNLLSLNPGRSRALYLDEIDVKGLTLKDVHPLKQKVFLIMDNKLRNYNVTWISSSPKSIVEAT